MQLSTGRGELLGSPPDAAQNPHAWHGGLREDQKPVLELCRLCLARVRGERLTYLETRFAQAMENYMELTVITNFFFLRTDNILQFQ